MRHSSLHPAPDERGFILVGVVTFMLALTILGLSLFALSSYEGQFFASSASREQALQDSESGMELVQALLAAPTSDLHTAHRAEGQLGITSAMAYQRRSASWSDTASSGPVNWDSTMVIVVSARRGGIERTLMASYLPASTQNPYQRLMAAGLGITALIEHSSPPSSLRLTGPVWQPVASPSTPLGQTVCSRTRAGAIESGTPPLVQANAFVDAQAGFWPRCRRATCTDNNNYRLRSSGLDVVAFTFFQSPADRPTTQRNENVDPGTRSCFHSTPART
jgi:hypothetical protein